MREATEEEDYSTKRGDCLKINFQSAHWGITEKKMHNIISIIDSHIRKLIDKVCVFFLCIVECGYNASAVFLSPLF